MERWARPGTTMSGAVPTPQGASLSARGRLAPAHAHSELSVKGRMCLETRSSLSFRKTSALWRWPSCFQPAIREKAIKITVGRGWFLCSFFTFWPLEDHTFHRAQLHAGCMSHGERLCPRTRSGRRNVSVSVPLPPSFKMPPLPVCPFNADGNAKAGHFADSHSEVDD